MKNELWSYIREKMLEHPEQTISEGDSAISFEDMCVFAENFASKLNGEFYGICCQSELAAVMAFLSCVAANVPAVPIPTKYGNQVYRRIIDAADPPYVITDMGGELHTLYMDPKTHVRFTSSPSVILYTSGSTGVPKGVMLSPNNLLNNIQDISSYLPLDCSDTFLISRSLYHSSVLTGELLVSLCKGCNIVFYSGAFNPGEMLKIIKKEHITATGSTPTLISTLSRFARGSVTDRIRLLSVSGECMTEGMAEQISSGFPNAKVYCGYGLSEASPRVAYLPPELFKVVPTSAGIALPSVQIKIVNDLGETVGENEVGELLVQGENVMTGYFKDPEKTSQTIMNKWLYTGDLAYYSNGLLYIKGRKDDMIIRSGMNIYPAEVENALSTDPRVTDLLVYGYNDGRTQQIGIKVRGDFASNEEVMALCRLKLAPYQIPNRIEIVDSISKGTTGKKRRKL